MSDLTTMHATTILSVRRNGKTAIAGDGQVTVGNTRHEEQCQESSQDVQRQGHRGFAGATADAFTLFEKFEAKLEQYPREPHARGRELAKTGGPTRSSAGSKR